MKWMRKLPPWNRPVVVGYFGLQAMLTFYSLWITWDLPSFGQSVNSALACLTVNMLIVAGFQRDAERNPL